MARRMRPAGFQDVGEADQVRLDVGARILERIAHAGLCCEMQHSVGLGARKETLERRGIDEVPVMEAEARMLQALQARPLQRHGIVGREAIDAHHLVAARQQALGAVHADEARGAGDHDLQRASALRSSRSFAYFM